MDPERGPALDADAIYLLEAYRDFGTTRTKDGFGRETEWSLCDAIRQRDRLATELAVLDDKLSAARMTDHARAQLEPQP